MLPSFLMGRRNRPGGPFCAKFGWLHIYGTLHMQLMHIILDNDVQKLHNKGEQEVQNRDETKRETDRKQADPKGSC